MVRRYAAMVFGVCLKTTRNAHDAEDATQAVFLNLAVHCKTDGRPSRTSARGSRRWPGGSPWTFDDRRSAARSAKRTTPPRTAQWQRERQRARQWRNRKASTSRN